MSAGRTAAEPADWVAELDRSGLLHPTPTPGLYARSARFESVVAGVEALVASRAVPDQPEVRRFPPVMALDTLARVGYPRSFPDLMGTVSTFAGNDAAHAELITRLEGGQDWWAGLTPAGTSLCSAACHPLYPTIAGPLPPGGRRFDVYGWVYRCEPSADPARQQSFRQYDQVYVGEEELAEAHASLWRARAAELLSGLGLDVRVVAANDPFFGRAGRMLASSQQESGLKYELVAATGPGAPATAIASTNRHLDHFATAFAITAADGSTAHSACVGFGVERVTLALLWAHGLDPAAWPESVRRQLKLT